MGQEPSLRVVPSTLQTYEFVATATAKITSFVFLKLGYLTPKEFVAVIAGVAGCYALARGVYKMNRGGGEKRSFRTTEFGTMLASLALIWSNPADPKHKALASLASVLGLVVSRAFAKHITRNQVQVLHI